MAQQPRSSPFDSQVPCQKDLDIVARCAGDNWRSLLTHLGVEFADIQSFLSKNGNNTNDACFQGLVYWLQSGVGHLEPATFGALFQALGEASMSGVASKLVEKLEARLAPRPLARESVAEVTPDDSTEDVERKLRVLTNTYHAWRANKKDLLLCIPRNETLEDLFDELVLSLKPVLDSLSQKEPALFSRLCQYVSLKCHRERGGEGEMCIPSTPEGAFQYIFQQSSVFEPVVVHKVIHKLENGDLIQALTRYESALADFCKKTFTSGKHRNVILQNKHTSRYTHMAIVSKQKELLLSLIFRQKEYFETYLKLDDIVYEGHQSGCTVVYFALLQSSDLLRAKIQEHSFTEGLKFPITHVIAFGDFIYNLEKEEFYDKYTSSPGPSPRTTPQPSERTNVDSLGNLNIRAAVSVARWEKYTFVPDVVRVLTDRNGLQKDSIEKATATRISFEGSPPTSSADSSSSLQPVIVSIYGTEEQVKNALFLITAQVQDNTPEFIQSSMPPHMDQRCAEAGQLNIYDKAKRDIKHDIGSKWRGLARALNFSQTDIDAIEVESRDDLPSQIFKMIHKWEQRQEKGKGTVFGLLQGLRTAANDSGDEIFRRFRDRIFSDILEEYILMSPNVCEMWQRIAKYLKFSGSDIYSCTLKDTNNKRTQAQAFLHLWVERYGWKVVEDLPVTLEKAGFEKDAAKVQDEVFGECSHLPLQQTVTPVPQSQPVDPVLEVDHLVVVQWAGLTLRGTLKWMGSLPGQDNMAGVELDEKYAVLEGTDVLCSGEKGNVKYTYFNSPAGLGAFFSQHDVSRDKRFLPDVDGQPDQPSLFAPQHLQMLDEAPRLVTRSMSNPVGSSSSYSSSFSTPSSKPRPSQTSSNIHTLSTVRSQDESPSQQNNLFLAQPQQESPSLSYRENLVVSPVQETTCNLSSINLLGAQAELDSPFHQQRPPTAHNTPNPSSNTSQQTSPISSPQAVASSEDISSSPKSKDHSFQPLLEVGEQKVYGLSFGGDVAGLIIGSGGATVNRIQDISHAKVEVVRKKGSSITEDTTLLVAGKEEHCLKAIEMMVESVQRKTERLQRFTEIMPLPDEQAGRVIGKDGQTLKAIQDYSGATITIESRPVGIVGILASGCNRDCEIRGSRIEINKAKSQIQRVMSGDNLSELMVARFVCQVLRQIAAG